jgi:hypothetical protein
MKHLTDEELVDLYYGERTGEPGGPGHSGDRSDERQHIASCVDCRDAFAALKRDLDAVPEIEPPAQAADYGQVVWQSIAPQLTRYEPRRFEWPRLSAGMRLGVGLGFAAACALLVAGGFFAGSLWESKHPQQAAARNPSPAAGSNTGAQAQPRVVVVVLSDHLDRSERFLVELKHADLDNSGTGTPLRDEARSLLAANRLCRKNVAPDDDPALSTALDHLDRLLAEAANSPGRLNGAALARLQEEMNGDGLLFEVRVLRSRSTDQISAGSDRPQGGTI